MGSYFLMMCIAIMVATAIARLQAPGDDARAAEWRNRLTAVLPVAVAVMAIAYAAIASALAFWILHGLSFGDEPREPILFLTIPVLAAVSALLAWIGLRLDRVCHLLARLKRACSAAVEAFHEPMSDDATPKPARSAYDLD
jgi:hypothetical protein